MCFRHDNVSHETECCTPQSSHRGTFFTIYLVYLFIITYIISQYGHSPIDLARIWDNHKVVKLLEREEKKLGKNS